LNRLFEGVVAVMLSAYATMSSSAPEPVITAATVTYWTAVTVAFAMIAQKTWTVFASQRS